MVGNSMIIAAIVAAGFAAVHCMSKPDFCGDFDCPPFDSQKFKDYELRSYGETKWIAASNISVSSNWATKGLFMKMFPYFRGANSERRPVRMSIPVVTKVQWLGGQEYKYTMMINLAETNPPELLSSDVEMITLPARDVYVKTFYKLAVLASNSDYEKNEDELRDSINNEALYDAYSYYQVGYTSPFYPARKHHEVWLDSV